MRTYLATAVSLMLAIQVVLPAAAQERMSGVRGDPEAIADAEAMVETMGGMEIWARLESLHFVHEWWPHNRIDSYIEDEILDLTGPRSWTRQESEISSRTRAYSPEEGYWVITNGEFARASDQIFTVAIQRAPFNFYRLVRGVAIGDPYYEIRYGEGDIPGSRRLEFYGPEGELHGWIILNARKEPIVKATTQYRYALGPLRRFGNLWVPDWGLYDNGYTRYEMISLDGSNHVPDRTLFAPPAGVEEQGPTEGSRP